MKTALREKLNTAAVAIQTQGQKAFKHPITSILSLCLVAGIAATITGFSQAPTEKIVAKDAELRSLQTVSLSLKSTFPNLIISNFGSYKFDQWQSMRGRGRVRRPSGR